MFFKYWLNLKTELNVPVNFLQMEALKVKIIITIMSAVLLFSLSACSGNSSGGSPSEKQTQTNKTSESTNSNAKSNKSTTSSKNGDTGNDNTQQSNNGSASEDTRSTDTDNQVKNRPTGAWVDTFEKELYDAYHVTPIRYENIGNGNWEVWVKETDTGDNPYVTVNENTGDFHG